MPRANGCFNKPCSGELLTRSVTCLPDRPVPTDALQRRGWCLYLVQCADGTLYTGITNDLQRRIAQHNSGTASRYTRSRLPVKLVYREGCRNKSGALKKEHRVKSLSRKAKDAYIAGATPLTP